VARRPNLRAKDEILTEHDLQELQHRLSLLSAWGVEDFYIGRTGVLPAGRPVSDGAGDSGAGDGVEAVAEGAVSEGRTSVKGGAVDFGQSRRNPGYTASPSEPGHRSDLIDPAPFER